MEQPVSEEDRRRSLIGRMTCLFWAPGETFEAVRRQAGWLDWFAPVLLVVILNLISLQIAKPVIQATQQEVLQERLKTLPEEQRQRAMAMAQKTGSIAALIGVPVSTFAILFVAGGVLLLIARFWLGGQTVTYSQTLAVWGYSSLVGALALLVRTPLMLAKNTAIVYTGLGVFVADEAMKTFVGRFVAGFDLFSFWQLCLAAIGLAVLTDTSIRRAFVPLLVLWFLWIAGQAALGGLGSGG